MNDQAAVAEDTVQGILSTWKSKPAFLVEILQDIQEEYNYLPREALEVTSDQLHVPMTQAIERVFEHLPRILNQQIVCSACRDKSKCCECSFINKLN